jgi:hypothetical protein
VLADVKSQADRCLNVVRRGWSSGGATIGPAMEQNVYHSATRKTASAMAEMTVQIERSAIARTSMPDGGWVMLLADMEGKGSATDVTVYGPTQPSAYKDVFVAVFEWAEGKPRGCPELP